MAASLRGSEVSEASDRERSTAATTAAASTVLLPLSNAWTYLGTLANTWLALSEKLRNSFDFCTGSGSFRSSSNTSNSNGSSSLFGTTAYYSNHKKDASSRTEVAAVLLDSNSQGRQRSQQQNLQHHQHQHSKQHPNGLEFSIADFLVVHLWRSRGSPPSRSSVVDSATASARSICPQPCLYSGFSSEGPNGGPNGAPNGEPNGGPSHSADGSASRNFWPLRQRLGVRSNSSPAGGTMERPFPPQLPLPQQRALSEPCRTRSTDKTLVLDLDETLIHAQRELTPDGTFDFMVILPPKQQTPVPQKIANSLALCAGRETSVAPSVVGQEAVSRVKRTEINEGLPVMQRCGSSVRRTTDYGGENGRRIYVRKRPHLRYFLETVSRQFEVVVFTAARADFANAVLEKIDPGRLMVDHVLSRESCTRLSKTLCSGDSGGGEVGGVGKKSIGSWGGRRCRGVAASSSAGSKRRAAMVKDLSILGRPLSKVIMVENSLDAIRYHLENGIHISSFYGDRGDTGLLSTLELLKPLIEADDVRDGIIRLYVQTQARKEGHNMLTDVSMEKAPLF